MPSSQEKPLRLNYATVMRYIKVLPFLIRENGVSHKEMEDLLGLSRTGVYDFRLALEKLHGSRVIELENKNLRLDPSDDFWLKNSFKPIVLEWPERLALDLILSIDLPYLPAEIRSAKKELLTKLALFDEDMQGPDRIILDAGRMFSLSNLGRVEADANLPFFNDPAMLDDLLMAIDTYQVCKVEYRNRQGDTPKKFRIKPLRFFEKQGAPFILVQIEKSSHFRCLRPAGILCVEQTDTKFDAMDSSAIDDHINSAFGTFYGDMKDVAIRFDAEIIPYIKERLWHPSQVFSEPDEAGQVVMRFSASGALDILRWVMSYGHHAKVLEPPELVQMVIQEVGALKKLYR